MLQKMLLLMLLAVTFNHELDAALSTDVDGMSSISCAEEMMPFRDKVIAYTAIAYHFHKGERVFILTADTPDFTATRYAAVFKKGACLELRACFNKRAIPSVIHLRNDDIKGSNLRVREVTAEEREQLKEAVKNDVAKLAYIFEQDEALWLLSQ